MSKKNAYRVFKEFKDGRTEYRGQRGQHSTPRGIPKQRNEENIAKIRALIEENSRSTVRELAIESGLGITTVQTIIKQDLGYTKKAARWVPRLLTPAHKAAKVQMAEDWIARWEADPDFKNKVRLFRHDDSELVNSSSRLPSLENSGICGVFAKFVAGM